MTTATNRPDVHSLMAQALREIKRLKGQVRELEEKASEPIAVVGMGCRIPGGADSPDAFWRLLSEGRNTTSLIPSDRWDVAGLYDPDAEKAGKMFTRHGNFLDGVREFDAAFFGISPREAVRLDPQQRLLMEVTWETLENAGVDPSGLSGSATGVFVGICWNDYDKILSAMDPEESNIYSMLGTARAGAAGRISHFLDLQGPGLSIDTACSSSLVSVHQACRSLRLGECSMALAGGVNLILTPHNIINASRAHMISRDGKCKTFDASADGFGRAEGCGMVLLKRLADAVDQGDNILALIRGSAVNQDGHTSGLTVPNGLAQKRVIELALADAGLEGKDVGFLEAHGTGTALGDPIEMDALKAVYCQNRQHPLVVGSVKTNIGHAEGAAGIVGLIKTVLCLQHKAIPRHLNFQKPNPHIHWDEAAVVIPFQHLPWEGGETPRRAGLSSFGFTGTNAHAILEEAPVTERKVAATDEPPRPLTLSAHTEQALRRLAGAYADYLVQQPEVSLGCLTANANLGRTRFPYRLSLAAGTHDQACQGLRAHAKGESSPGLWTGKTWAGGGDVSDEKLAFLFTGQGSQVVGMGRELYETEPVFRESIDQCEQLLRHDLGQPLTAVLYPPDGVESPIHDTAYAQPALFALEVALARLWHAWGIEPSAVLGHSVGEFAAAWLAGVFSLEDGCRLIAARGRLMSALPRKGRMVAVFAARERVASAIAPHEKRLAIAAVNGPTHTVISGHGEALDAVLSELRGEGFKCRELEVSHAFHSPLMAPMLDDFRAVAASLNYRAPHLEIIANRAPGTTTAAINTSEYWVDQVLAEVHFQAGINDLYGRGYRLFMELGPDPVLLGMARHCLEERDGTWLPSLRAGQKDGRQMCRSLAELYVHGAPISWQGVHHQGRGRHLTLPSYPFQRERYWVETPARRSCSETEVPFQALNPLLITHPDAPYRKLAESGQSLWFAAADLVHDPELAATIGDLSRRYTTAPGAVGQVTGRVFIYINAARTAFFYCNHREHMLVAQSYTGAMEDYGDLVTDLGALCTARSLELNLIVIGETQRQQLQELRFSSTVIGAWQNLENLAEFNTKGSKMRRLRYAANRYSQSGSCTTEEYRIGSDRQTDREILDIIGAWSQHKARGVTPLTAYLRDAVEMGWPGCENRFFLVRREGRLDGLLLILPCAMVNGFLMDMEFYAKDIPQGAMEFGIVNIIQSLVSEGAACFSLGLTFFTQLHDHPNQDPEIKSLMDDIYGRETMNGDANFQFKQKFRPLDQPVWLCRPHDLGHNHAAEFLLMLADPTNQTSYEPRAATPTVAAGGSNQAEFHPLCHRRLNLATRETVFESQLDLNGSLSFLTDHRIGGKILFPAAGFVEMALSAAAQVMDAPALTDLEITRPLTLNREERAHIQVILEPETRGTRSFRITSLTAGDWIDHAGGRLVRREPQPAPIDLDQLAARCPIRMAGEELYRNFEDMGFDYGPGFRNVGSVALGKSESLIQLNLRYGMTTSGYTTHPALLDACLHGCQGLLGASDEGDAVYLPIAIERFTAWQPISEQALVWARLREGETRAVVLDLDIFDGDGKPSAAIRGLMLRRAAISARSGESKVSDRLLYAPEWVPQPRGSGRKQEDHYLIFADREGIGEALGLMVEESTLVYPGAEASTLDEKTVQIDATDPDQVAHLLEGLPERINLVYLWPLDLEWREDGCRLQEELLNTIMPLTNLAGGLRRHQVKIWIVTRNSRFVPDHPNPKAGPGGVWGFARVLANEKPHLWGGIIDLGNHDLLDAAELLQSEIGQPDGCDQIVWREEERFVPLLRDWTQPLGGPPEFSADVTYLVSGGLGGIGLHCARWLVDQGARHLKLISRNPPNPQQTEKMVSLQAKGANVTHAAIDMGDETALAEVIAAIQASSAPLAGVFHSAGLARDNLLERQTRADFEAVLRPKLLGAWNLHRQTLDLQLQHFVMFSSISSQLGTIGQANYSAANDFLDSLAHLRHQQGQPGLSINWGPWASAGMAARLGEVARNARRAMGIEDLSPEQGLTALGQALTTDRAQLAVCALIPDVLAKAELAELPLLRELVAPLRGRDGGTNDNSPHGRLSAVPEDDRPRAMSTYLTARLAEVLGVDPEKLDPHQPLNTMGVDSLMVMQLRNLLRDEIKVALPAMLFFDFPTIHVLTAKVLEVFQPARMKIEAERSNLRERFIRADREQGSRFIGDYLSRSLAEILHRDEADLDRDAPLNRLGMDSLLMMELRNSLKADLELDLPMIAFFDFPSINLLTDMVLERLNTDAGSVKPKNEGEAA